jgi:transposase-like protein
VRTAAADRAEQIRLGLQSTAVLYAKAVEEEDWRVLGYRSVTDWATKEFGPDRFSAERRKEIVALLTDAGLTVRQIARATGAGKSTVARDQREAGPVPDGTPGDDGNAVPVSDNQQVTENQSPRQQAAREREAAKRTKSRVLSPAEVDRRLELVPDEGPMVTRSGRVLTEDDVRALADEEAARYQELLRADAAAVADDDLDDEATYRREWDDADTPVTPEFHGHAYDDPDPRAMQQYKPVLMPPYKITAADIEVIITGNLTRGQIRDRFGVGEHAAQLARVAALAIRVERDRQATAVANRAFAQPADAKLSPRLIALLREQAEAYFGYRATQNLTTMMGTDRTKVTLFLDWLAGQEEAT